MLDTEYSDATKFVMILDETTMPQLNMLLKLARLQHDGDVVKTPHPAGRLMYNPAVIRLKAESHTPMTQDRHNFIMEAVEEKRERDMAAVGKPLYETYPQGGRIPNSEQVQQAFKAAGAPYTPQQFRVMRDLRDAMETGHLYICSSSNMTEFEMNALTYCMVRAYSAPGSENQSRVARAESYILAAVIEKIILDTMNRLPQTHDTNSLVG